MHLKPTPTTIDDFLAKHQAIVCKIARSFASDAGEQDDLAQEICIRLMMVYDRLPDDVAETTYVYRVAMNCAISWNRKQRTYLKHLKHFWACRVRRQSSACDTNNNDDVEQLYRGIRRLGESDRALIVMYLDKRNSHQMAQVLGVEPAAIRKRVSRIKQKLSKIVQLDWGSDDH